MEAVGLLKSYGSVEALRDMSFAVEQCETVALVGDNGAGKSTAVKVITGALPPDGGLVRVNGAHVRFRSPRDAQNAGVAVVYQDLALVNVLSVAQNVFLGDIPTRGLRVDKRKMARESERVLEELAINVPSVTDPVSSLSGGQRQAVAIARAVRRGGRLMVMDEPTAALGVQESAKVLDLIRELQRRGLSVLLVSHNIDHVFAVADRVVVLRHGRIAGVCDTRTSSHSDVVHLIVGAQAGGIGPGSDGDDDLGRAGI
jgi:ABC-type sugar transport system ATPase subunit